MFATGGRVGKVTLLTWFLMCGSHVCHQAEEQLKLVEEQRQMLERKQKLEDEERRRAKREQEVILNKKNARPRLSFSLGGKS